MTDSTRQGDDLHRNRAARRKGCLSPGRLFLKLVLATLVLIVILIHSPPDLSRFEHHGDNPMPVGPMSGKTNLALLRSKTAPMSPPFRLHEADINRYLAGAISGHHKAGIGKFVGLDSIAIDLRDGTFEVLIERRILGRTASQTARFKIERIGGHMLIRPAGGSLGRLPLPSRIPMIGRAAFAEVARVLAPEINLLLGVERIDFSDGCAEIHPFQ